MGSLTSANCVLTIAIPGLYDTPQQLQKFAADDVTDIGDQQVAEAVMGVDGFLSMGFVFNPTVQGITLQGDSESNAIFDNWYGAQQSTREIYRCSGILLLPAIGRKWSLVNGGMTTYKPAPDVKKILQARKHTITWESMQIAPI